MPDGHESNLQYEELRRRVLARSSTSAPGLAVLLRKGVVSWMEILPKSFDKPRPPAQEPQTSRQDVALDTKQEIVRLLASVALSIGSPEGN